MTTYNHNQTRPEPTCRKCPECERVFDLRDYDDANEWHYGHDCEGSSENPTTTHEHVPFDVVPLYILDGRWDVRQRIHDGQFVEIAKNGGWLRVTERTAAGFTTYYRSKETPCAPPK